MYKERDKNYDRRVCYMVKDFRINFFFVVKRFIFFFKMFIEWKEL